MILNVCSRNSRNLIEENPGLRNPLMLVLQSPRKCHLPSSCGLWIKNALFALQSPNLRQAFSQLTTSPNIPHKLFPAASHIFFFYFWCRPFFFYLLNLLQHCFCYIPFVFFGHEACESSAPRPGIEPPPPALEGRVLTTGPPGKSLTHSFYLPGPWWLFSLQSLSSRLVLGLATPDQPGLDHKEGKFHFINLPQTLSQLKTKISNWHMNIQGWLFWTF